MLPLRFVQVEPGTGPLNLFAVWGAPEHIRSDNEHEGSFVAKEVQHLTQRRSGAGASTLYISGQSRRTATWNRPERQDCGTAAQTASYATTSGKKHHAWCELALDYNHRRAALVVAWQTPAAYAAHVQRTRRPRCSRSPMLITPVGAAPLPTGSCIRSHQCLRLVS